MADLRVPASESRIEAVAESLPPERARPLWRGSYYGPTIVLALAIFIGLTAFLTIEPTPLWLIALLVILTTLGADGIIRSHPRIATPVVAETAPYLFVPTLLVLGSGLLMEDLLSGYWLVAGAAGVGLLLGVTIACEYTAVDQSARAYPIVRTLLVAVAYLTAYLLFALIYRFDLSLLPAATVVGVVSLLSAVEVLRESESNGWRILTYATAIAIVLAEVRWTLYYLPLSESAAGLMLFVVFYLAANLLLHHLRRDFSRAVAVELIVVGLAGLALVIFTTNVT